MIWKNQFYEYLIKRGNIWYLGGRVIALTHNNNTYRGTVRDICNHNVTITVDNNEVVNKTCTCHSGRNKNPCVHMAAVCFKIDEELRKTEKKKKEIRPFSDESKDDKVKYCFFDMEKMTKNLLFFEQDFIEAKRLVERKEVELKSVEFALGKGTANGYYKYNEHIQRSVLIMFDSDEIISVSCNVPGCDGTFHNFLFRENDKHVCSHGLALLMLLKEYLETQNRTDATDKNGEMMFKQFRKLQVKKTLEQQEAVKDLIFEPVLEREKRGLYFGFRAGVKKTYVVNDLNAFINHYEQMEVVTFGKKAEVDLAKHRFTESSEKIYGYVKHLVEGENRFLKRMELSPYARYQGGIDKNRIGLFGARLDTFFEMLEGKTLECKDKTEGKSCKVSLKFMTAKPEINAAIKGISDEKKVFHGVAMTGRFPDMIAGEKHHYYFKENAFCKLDKEVEQELLQVVGTDNAGEFCFRVGRNHLAEFYHQVLPVLKKHVEVEEPELEVIQEYIPPAAQFVINLDAVNKKIICEPMVRYGEAEYSLLDNMKKDKVIESVRNCEQEKDVLEQLGEYFPQVNVKKDALICESEEMIYQLLDGGVGRLEAIGMVYATDRFKNLKIRKRPAVQLGVSVGSDLLDLSISAEDMDREEIFEILKAYREKKTYHRLKNGDFAVLGDDGLDLEKLDEMLKTLHISEKDFLKEHIEIPKYRALYLNRMLEESEDIYLSRDAHFEKLIGEFETPGNDLPEVPELLKPIMKNYQVQGFQWLKTLEKHSFGGILADDMGLGKTLQMISVLLSAKECKNLSTALIVCPASVVYNWKEEIRRFTKGSLKVDLIVGDKESRKALIKNHEGIDVLVTSYDLLKRDIAEFENVQFSHMVLDEAQYIKNHNTAAAKSVKSVKAEHRFALTGTPIENRLSELWSIFDFLMKGYLYKYENFRRTFEIPIVKNGDEEVSTNLKKMIGPFVLRRLKKDVLTDLPEKVEEIRYVKMGKEQQTLYDAKVKLMKEELAAQKDDDFQNNRFKVLANLLTIRQICCDPTIKFDYNGESAKRIACLDLIRSGMEGNHKMLVFSQFEKMLSLLESCLKREGIACYKLVGDVKSADRLEMINAFNEDDTPVFLISTKAGGTGVNLTGADVVIHYEPWWNYATENQATDRAYRIGQTKNVTVYKLLVKGSVEEKIHEMQERKKELSEKVLGDGSLETVGTNDLMKMSKEELLELLNG